MGCMSFEEHGMHFLVDKSTMAKKSVRLQPSTPCLSSDKSISTQYQLIKWMAMRADKGQKQDKTQSLG